MKERMEKDEVLQQEEAAVSTEVNEVADSVEEKPLDQNVRLMSPTVEIQAEIPCVSLEITLAVISVSL